MNILTDITFSAQTEQSMQDDTSQYQLTIDTTLTMSIYNFLLKKNTRSERKIVIWYDWRTQKEQHAVSR